METCGGFINPWLEESQRSLQAINKYCSLIASLCEGSQRTFVEEDPDGHCGFRGLSRKLFNKGTDTESIDASHVEFGRNFIASALRTHSTSIVELIASQYGHGETEACRIVDEIEARAQLHESCDPASICGDEYHFSGKFSMDCRAFAMKTIRPI